MIMRLIDADKMATDELAAFISAQAKTNNVVNRDVNSIVHEKNPAADCGHPDCRRCRAGCTLQGLSVF